MDNPYVRIITFTDGTGFTVIHREPRTEEQWQTDFKRIAAREGKTIVELSAHPSELSPLT